MSKKKKRRDLMKDTRQALSDQITPMVKGNTMINKETIPRIFIGYDPRQPLSYNVLQYSIQRNARGYVDIYPLKIEWMPIKRVGLTPFTFSRFCVPYLCNYEGFALFLDADILVLDDIYKLFEYCDDQYDIQVIKNKNRFEWASVMLFNNAKCKQLTPEYVETAEKLHGIPWTDESKIGDLPSEWNHLVGYDAPRRDVKLVHYTQGMPCYEITRHSEYRKEFNDYYNEMISIASWEEIMGMSIHTKRLANGKVVPKLYIEE